jgi:hypothetical protein
MKLRSQWHEESPRVQIDIGTPGNEPVPAPVER